MIKRVKADIEGEDKKTVSVVIITHNRKAKLVRLIFSILSQDNFQIKEIIVIDDASNDGTEDAVKKRFGASNKFKYVKNKKNILASASRNIGAGLATGEFILFFDDDIICEPNCIKELISGLYEDSNEKKIIGPMIMEYNNKKKIWFNAMKLNLWTTNGIFCNKAVTKIYNNHFIKTDALVTAFAMKRSHFFEIGKFDEFNFPFQFEEMDFFIRARYLGFHLYTNTDSIILHDHESAAFLNHPWRLYFTSKNRFLTCKLWSVNYPQYIVSMFFSVVHLILYIFLKIFIYRHNRTKCFRAMFSGAIDGIFGMRNLVPYRLRKNFSTKNINFSSFKD